MAYTIADFVAQTEVKPVFVEGLPEGVDPAKAAAKLKQLAIPLKTNSEEVARFSEFKTGWFPDRRLEIYSEQDEYLFSLGMSNCSGCVVRGVGIALQITCQEGLTKYLTD